MELTYYHYYKPLNSTAVKIFSQKMLFFVKAEIPVVLVRFPETNRPE